MTIGASDLRTGDMLSIIDQDSSGAYSLSLTDTTAIDQGLLDDGTAFLSKPFTPGVLLERIAALMAESAV